MRASFLAAPLLALAAAVPATAALPAALQGFIGGLTTFTADFEQQVQDAQGQSVARGRGMLWVQRPGRFRWDYKPAVNRSDGAGSSRSAEAGSADSGQLLLADGSNLWLYERDLAQATVRDAASADAAAPMLLLSGDAVQIEAAFSLTAEPDRDGLHWVEVRPRAAAADFARAELAFRGTALARMIISDKLGQVTTLLITRSQRNPRLDATLFRFTPPQGVDVIGTVRP
jgi:outer membrane lipoprotein carrier protein